VDNGVTIIGPLNLPAEVPYHASQMYSKNVNNLLLHLIGKDGLKVDLADEITRETMVTHEGEVTNVRMRELLGLPAAATASA
jgi:NAD(P) transhydrogenase subunit alpha